MAVFDVSLIDGLTFQDLTSGQPVDQFMDKPGGTYVVSVCNDSTFTNRMNDEEKGFIHTWLEIRYYDENGVLQTWTEDGQEVSAVMYSYVGEHNTGWDISPAYSPYYDAVFDPNTRERGDSGITERLTFVYDNLDQTAIINLLRVFT